MNYNVLHATPFLFLHDGLSGLTEVIYTSKFDAREVIEIFILGRYIFTKLDIISFYLLK